MRMLGWTGWAAGLAIASAVMTAACAATPEGNDSADGPTGTVQSAVGIGIPPSLNLPRKPGRVFLTFDDGPSSVTTPIVLKTLEEKGVKATFFITGINIKGHEELIRSEHKAGHIVANHQWEHIQASTAQLQVWAPRERDLLDSILAPLGTKHERYFRYPFGSGTTAKEAVLKADGYPDGGIGWNMDSLDWCFGAKGVCRRPEVPSAYQSDFMGFVKNHMKSKSGNGIILFHDIQKITATHIGDLIDWMRAQGWELEQLPRPPVGTNGAK